jgi:2-haloacid dehalogenase
MIKAIAFDAYGTIFDVHSVGVLADTIVPYRGAELAALWRTKQIDYTRLRTMSDRYVPFSQVTRDALRYSTQALGLAIGDDDADRLMAEYDRLAVFPDAEATLARLGGLQIPMAILSNGDPRMLDAVVGHAGLTATFDHLLSVDTVRRFKTAPDAYALGPAAFGCAVDEILFVSSNCWDACGATWYGYHTFWINRAGLPVEVLDVAPTAIGQSMLDVLAHVAAHHAARAA